MPKPLWSLDTTLMVALIAVWVGGWVPLVSAGAREVKPKAPVPQTGQMTSYATGDDGDLQAGVTWPVPRFTDRGNGTVRDNLTGLIWLKQANCFGPQLWLNALQAVNTVASPNCGLSDGSVAGDWRLPNIKELQSLIHFGSFSPALSNAAGTGPWTEGDAFSGVEHHGYWSSTSTGAGSAWLVALGSGSAIAVAIDGTYLVWPVQGGD
jgi:Protein of unknown function (DUF1566)